MRILQDRLASDIEGILWVTSHSLAKHPYPFDLLDYFFDGILSQSLQHMEVDSIEKNIFFSTNFGRSFFLAQFSQEYYQQKSFFKDVFNVIKGVNNTKKKILVFDKTKGQIVDKFQKMYPTLKFTSLYLDHS